MGGPTIEGTAHDQITGLEICGGKPFLVDDLFAETGQKLFIEDPDDSVGIAGRFIGPVDAFRLRRGVDEEEVVVVVGRGIRRLGAGAETEINRGVLGRLFLPKHLPKLERVVIGEKDVVMV